MAAFSLILSVPFALYVLWRLYDRLRVDPLASAKQAHWSAPYTGLWIWWQDVQDRSAEAVHQAHLRHGPVVQLGPSELSVCCVEGGLDVIYSFKQGMPKTDWYQVANSHSEEPMVAIKDEIRHRERKRMLAQPYSKTALRTDKLWINMQSQLTARLTSVLNHMTNQESCSDFYDLAFAWSVDSTSEYVFGSAARPSLLDDLPKARRTRETYEQQRAYQFLPLPATILGLLGYAAEISWMTEMLHRARFAAPQEIGAVLDNFTRALAWKSDAHGETVSKHDDAVLSGELQDHMVAGIDTSAAILTASAWCLSLPVNEIWQNRLSDGLRSAKQPTAAADLEILPVLDVKSATQHT